MLRYHAMWQCIILALCLLPVCMTSLRIYHANTRVAFIIFPRLARKCPHHLQS